MMQSVVQNTGCNHRHYIRFHGLEMQLLARNRGDRLQPAAMYACQRPAGATGVLHEARKRGGRTVSGRPYQPAGAHISSTDKERQLSQTVGLYEQTHAIAPDRYMSPEGFALRAHPVTRCTRDTRYRPRVARPSGDIYLSGAQTYGRR